MGGPNRPARRSRARMARSAAQMLPTTLAPDPFEAAQRPSGTPLEAVPRPSRGRPGAVPRPPGRSPRVLELPGDGHPGASRRAVPGCPRDTRGRSKVAGISPGCHRVPPDGGPRAGRCRPDPVAPGPRPRLEPERRRTSARTVRARPEADFCRRCGRDHRRAVGGVGRARCDDPTRRGSESPGLGRCATRRTRWRGAGGWARARAEGGAACTQTGICQGCRRP